LAARELDVLCIGNAIVDVLSRCSHERIDELDLTRGAMTLIEADRAEDLYRAMGPAIEASGGSACNTAAGIASFGGRAGYIGKVRDDQLGDIFAHDIRSLGAEFTTPSATSGPPTARCFIFVTPDGQRTMNTYLGACVNLTSADVDPELVARARVTYLEGYLWDPEEAKQAFLRAASLAHEAGNEVSLTLSDPFCVDRHRGSFLDLVRDHVDVLFANEQEIVSLYEVEDFDVALQHVRHDCRVAALTRGAHGSVIVAGDELHVIPADPIEQVVDTTGAGDLYAAGFLLGYTRGADLATCGRLGSMAASEVIGHIGPRPRGDLAERAAARGLELPPA
jgi:sugar/nucleoside kinase (ribokinase family)